MIEPNMINRMKDRIFLVNYSEIEERYDPFFYLPYFNKDFYKQKNWVGLKDLSTSISHPPEYQRNYSPNGLQLIRAQNVRPTGIEIDNNPVYFSKEYLKNKRIINPQIGDVLIVRSGVNAGDVATIEKIYKNAIIGADNLLIRPKNRKIGKYLQAFFFTDFGKRLMNRYITGATNKHISPHNLSKIKIPIFDNIDIVIKLFDVSIQRKKEKEKKVKELLNCIDEYLLNELKISLPILNNDIENRIFKINFSKVTGNRFDPKSYEKNANKLKEAIYNSYFDKIKLRQLIIHKISGDWGIEINQNFDLNDFEKCLVIRSTEFDNDFNLKIESGREKERLIKKSKLIQLDIKEDDIFVEKSGGSPNQPVGRVAIVEKELLDNYKICFSNFIEKIRLDKKFIIPKYAFYFLKTMHNIGLTKIMQAQTHGILNLNMNEYFNQPIILPELKYQEKIVKKIDEIKYESMQLINQANIEFENTKKEIEQMILGE